MTNIHTITSPSQFQELLSKDLNRVSLINFWAPWAEPCTQMNTVVKELALKYEHLLVLQVEAEEQPDIAESFDIEAVPSILVLRGHTLLGRVHGANAVELTQMIATHAKQPAVVPLSKTTAAPAAAPPISETEALNDRLRRLMSQSRVVLFMKGAPDAPECGFSRRTVELLRVKKIEFTHFDILTDESVRQGLKVLNNWPTFPQVIINGELVGGLDVVTEMSENGELEELLN